MKKTKITSILIRLPFDLVDEWQWVIDASEHRGNRTAYAESLIRRDVQAARDAKIAQAKIEAKRKAAGQ